MIFVPAEFDEKISFLYCEISQLFAVDFEAINNQIY